MSDALDNAAVPPAPKIVPNRKPKSRVIPALATSDAPASVVNNVIVREIVDPTPDAEDSDGMLDDLPLEVLSAVVRGLNHGQPLGDAEPHAKRLASHAQDKAELVGALIQSHELDRLVANVQSRAILERLQNRAIRRGDLTTLEVMALLERVSGEIKDGVALLKKANPALDSITVIEKVNSARQEVEKTTQQKFTGTTAQGREIIRRSLFAMIAAGKRAAEAPVDVEASAKDENG